MHLYRVCLSRHADDLSGEGARLYGGRWNSPGLPALYTSASRSLAMLEILVHADAHLLRMLHRCVSIELPDDSALLRRLQPDELPDGWQAYPAPLGLRRIGDAFLEAGEHLGLILPSAVVPQETNCLLNPRHHRFGEVQLVDSVEQPFDPRL